VLRSVVAVMQAVCVPVSQSEFGWELTLLIRAGQRPAALLPQVERVLGEMNREITLLQPQTLETRINDSIFLERITATLSGFFGGLALLLASVGLYGVTAYSVARRTSEIGIRMALGAERAALLLGVKPVNPASFALTVVVLLAAGLAALFVPARRASTMDPMLALRQE
jgi:ABC-type antimicrobial peptide transport system permease subunit